MSSDTAIIAIGKLGRPHGLRGELRFWPRNPACEMVRTGREIRVGTKPSRTRSYRIVATRRDAKGPLVRLEGVADRTAAEALTGRTWYEPRSAFPEAQADEVYLVDLIGLPARLESGEPLGALTDVWQVGAADVLVIVDAASGRQTLVPNVEEFVLCADPDKGEIVIRPIEGLVDA